jgi:CheY-like chemotaxis protein
MDGYRATRAIRNEFPFASSEEIRSIPIVAMTASAIEGVKEMCEAVSIAMFKPQDSL